MLKLKTEEELITLLQTGSDTAVAELLERYKNKLYTAIYILVKDKYTAEDIFQESCIKVINTIRKGKYSDEGKFLPWALRIARNLSIDYLRVAKRQVKVTLPDGTDIFSVLNFNTTNNREEDIIKKQSGDKVKHMLEYLPFEQREVIVLRLFAELNFKQIAEHTKVSLNTALGRMRYGLINLRKIMEEKQIVL